jgi:hypothetical protein
MLFSSFARLMSNDQLDRGYRALLIGVWLGIIVVAVLVAVQLSVALGFISGVTVGLYMTAVVVSRWAATKGKITRTMSWSITLAGAFVLAGLTTPAYYFVS